MNTTSTPLELAIDKVGLAELGRQLGVTYQAILKWKARGRMPRTEWTGETNYSETIARLTNGAVTKDRLLAPWPKPEPAATAPTQEPVDV